MTGDANGGATPASSHRPQPQDLTPQRRIVRTTRAQGRDVRDMIEEGSGGAKKRKKHHKSYRRDINEVDFGGRSEK